MKRYVSAREARDILGVSEFTVNRWISLGRIKARKMKLEGYKSYKLRVLVSSLKDAFNVRCHLCGEIFRSKGPGDPAKRKFCCYEHKVEWFLRERRRYVRRGRPPKDPKARKALRVKK